MPAEHNTSIFASKLQPMSKVFNTNATHPSTRLTALHRLACCFALPACCSSIISCARAPYALLGQLYRSVFSTRPCLPCDQQGGIMGLLLRPRSFPNVILSARMYIYVYMYVQPSTQRGWKLRFPRSSSSTSGTPCSATTSGPPAASAPPPRPAAELAWEPQAV